jgi:hypothetical protein
VLTLACVWVGVAAALTVTLRSVGPWWRVAPGCLLWPLLPAIAAISKARHAWQRAASLAKGNCD